MILLKSSRELQIFASMNTSVNQRILGQILFWSVLFLGIPYLIMGNEFLSKHIVRASMMTSGVIIMTVLNLKFLFPRFYINGNFTRYIIFTIITILTLRILYTLLLELGGFYLLDEMEKRIANLPFQPMTHRKVLILNTFFFLIHKTTRFCPFSPFMKLDPFPSLFSVFVSFAFLTSYWSL